MAGPIGRVPRGLSSLLQLKGGISNPPETIDALVPTLNLLEFYQLDKRERAVSSILNVPHTSLFASAVIDGAGDTVVPDDEAWIVWHAHWEGLVPGAFIELAGVPAIKPSGSPSRSNLPGGPLSGAAVTGGDFLSVAYAEMPLFVLPGTIFSLVINKSAVAPANMDFALKLEFTRLDI